MANNINISYDLYAPGQKYDRVIERIKSLGSWAKVHKSYWYLSTNLNAAQVCDAVWAVMDPNDSLYVIDGTNNSAAWRNIDSNVETFIKNHWLLKAA
ncbi:CRISPR-associated protein Cas2 [Hoeflea sp.]|uniref:CRISPR-associated protein Cas2 n=1 Tax=Hoeflea sp. TaxID=1940281 RepID=UPI003A94FADD